MEKIFTTNKQGMETATPKGDSEFLKNREENNMNEKLKTININEHLELLSEHIAYSCGWDHKYTKNWSESELVLYPDAVESFRDDKISLNEDELKENNNYVEYESNGYSETYFDIDGIVFLFSSASEFWYVFR